MRPTARSHRTMSYPPVLCQDLNCRNCKEKCRWYIKQLKRLQQPPRNMQERLGTSCFTVKSQWLFDPSNDDMLPFSARSCKVLCLASVKKMSYYFWIPAKDIFFFYLHNKMRKKANNLFSYCFSKWLWPLFLIHVQNRSRWEFDFAIVRCCLRFQNEKWTQPFSQPIPFAGSLISSIRNDSLYFLKHDNRVVVSSVPKGFWDIKRLLRPDVKVAPEISSVDEHKSWFNAFRS